MKIGPSLAALAMVSAIASCDAPKGDQKMTKPTDEAASELRALSGARIFFGHQSVGYNILDGLAAMAKASGQEGPSILEGRDAKALDSPRLLHAAIGANGDPLGKIKDFEGIVDAGVGAKADLALMKFCYVDIVAGTDVDAVFAAYSQALARLRAKYPKTAFPMATVPLTTVQSGPKAWLKRLLGRPLNGQADDAARERLNALIRGAAGGQPLFDLALAEASGPDGETQGGSYAGSPYLALRDEYSSDGGHLNAAGARAAAAGFAASLASALSPLVGSRR
jgi:lysophospholipase L1-like esterase